MAPVVQYCPRCDKSFLAITTKKAWDMVVAHIKKAHPEYIDQLED